jgi:hypothetical protein
MGRPGGRRRLRLAVASGAAGVVVAAGVLVVVAVMGVALFFGGTPDPAPGAPGTGCGTDGGGATPPLPVLASGPTVDTLDAEQTGNARTIVQIAASLSASHGVDAGAARRAAVIGIMTAMQESTLRNLNYGDRDSLGLFQQRPSAGWGTADQVQDPVYAAGKFFDHLVEIPGWETGRLTDVAQAVQRSAFPEAYEQWGDLAEKLAAAVKREGPGTLACH